MSRDPILSSSWSDAWPLPDTFFDCDALLVARKLLGKVIRHRQGNLQLAARTTETEAYHLEERGSHASFGYIEKRKALLLDGGHIYMCYARGGDSLNFSAGGPGNAVLIKSGHPRLDRISDHVVLERMQSLNPDSQGRPREIGRLHAGQTLLCKAMGLKAPEWDVQRFDPQRLFVDDVGERPDQVIQAAWLGIPKGRGEHLPYRFADVAFAAFCTRNPLRRGQVTERDYHLLGHQDPHLQ